MKRPIRTLLIVAALLLSLGTGVVLPSLLAAPTSLAYMPVVQAPNPPVRDALVYSCQCGAVIASPMPDGRVLLTIQDHSRSGAAIVGIDDGTKFIELPNRIPPFPGEPFPTPGAAPGYDFPGDKQGVGSSLVIWGKVVTWAPNRVGTSRYDIWRSVQDIPPVQS